MGTSESEDSEEEANSVDSDRVWLIQCKRERTITPQKMRNHLAAIPRASTKDLYGIVFAAACDFSKKTRDVLIAWAQKNGVSEWHLWGKAELEDQLLQPKNDNLLFAYFGISVAVRRRSQAADIRKMIAIKRRLRKFLEGQNDRIVLIRDLADEDYPYRPEGGAPPRWRARRALKLASSGVEVRVSMRPAWLGSDGTSWDAVLGSIGSDLSSGKDPGWNETEEALRIQTLANDYWHSLPQEERAWLYLESWVPYKNIEVIDDIGDDVFDGPHIFVSDWDKGYERVYAYIETVYGPRRSLDEASPDDPNRVPKYPEETRHRKEDFSGF